VHEVMHIKLSVPHFLILDPASHSQETRVWEGPFSPPHKKEEIARLLARLQPCRTARSSHKMACAAVRDLQTVRCDPIKAHAISYTDRVRLKIRAWKELTEYSSLCPEYMYTTREFRSSSFLTCCNLESLEATYSNETIESLRGVSASWCRQEVSGCLGS
jgi:hypothetical protein